ncbi:hypothetical protein [Corynebacterium minutissimum]|uniref:hypothetical protein n=1 Tax=Corynebacterium minutissimum TaxID=38301 RepID=UPI0011C067A6|nr:hypothetical protein [Corynebacterium minutissimum]QRP60174.1 hypothetical protein I6J26_08205 [Corynebacterium minutissimum]
MSKNSRGDTLASRTTCAGARGDDVIRMRPTEPVELDGDEGGVGKRPPRFDVLAWLVEAWGAPRPTRGEKARRPTSLRGGGPSLRLCGKLLLPTRTV